MKTRFVTTIFLLFNLGFWASASVYGAATNPALEKVKKEAEAKGFIFETSQEEIVARAKSEAKLRVLSGWDRDLFSHLKAAFQKRYPFIDVHIEETAGIDAAQRHVLEVKAGAAKGWDVLNNHPDFYFDLAPYLKKFDILGMARQGILRIPVQMIDPVHRNILLVSGHIQVLAFNKKLIPAERLPSTWEDLLMPEFKGKKFAADMRPTQIAALAPAWGLEKTVTFARRIAAQEPIWIRGGDRNVAAVIAGEYPIFIAPNYSTIKRAEAKDPTGVLGFRVLEPVPTRLSKSPGILENAEHPYAALLWVEFEASLEAQKLADKYEPYGASIFIPGSALEEVTRGRRLSVVDWDHFHKMKEYQARIVEAYGFPKAGKTK